MDTVCPFFNSIFNSCIFSSFVISNCGSPATCFFLNLIALWSEINFVFLFHSSNSWVIGKFNWHTLSSNNEWFFEFSCLELRRNWLGMEPNKSRIWAYRVLDGAFSSTRLRQEPFVFTSARSGNVLRVSDRDRSCPWNRRSSRNVSRWWPGPYLPVHQ